MYLKQSEQGETMTKDEALKMALEALEADELDMVDDGSGNMVFRKEQAIAAIKKALSEPEQDGQCKRCIDGCPACDARKLPEPEPVAWEQFYPDIGKPQIAFNAEVIGYVAPQPKQEPMAWISAGPARMIHWTSDKPAYGDDWVPLYTAPPQRKPLTLGQKQRLWSSVGDKPTLKDRVNAYGLAIEAAHGIKE